MLRKGILIVGDDQKVVETLRHRLEYYNYNLFVSPDSKSALETIDAHRPAFILLGNPTLGGDEMELLQRIILKYQEAVFVMLTPDEMLDVTAEIQPLMGDTLAAKHAQQDQLLERQF